jgi:hypothetical protein
MLKEGSSIEDVNSSIAPKPKKAVKKVAKGKV